MNRADGFRGRLVSAIILVNAAVIALAGLSLLQSRENYQIRAKDAAENLSLLLAGNIDSSFQKIEIGLLASRDEIERNAARSGSSRSDIAEVLERQRRRLPELNGLRFADATGAILYGTAVIPGSTITISDRNYYIRLRDDAKAGLVISEPVLGRVSGQWGISIALRCNKPDGSFLGVVYATILSSQFSETFASVVLGAKGVISLRGLDQAMVARYPELHEAVGSVGNTIVSPEYKITLGKNPVHGIYVAPTGLDRITRLVSYRRTAVFPGYIIVGLSSDDYFSGWRREVDKFAIILSVFFIVTLMFGNLFWKMWKKQLENTAALEREEEKLHTIADYTYDWEYWEGPSRELLFISPSCERITGYSQAEFLDDGELIRKIIHPEDGHRMVEHLHQIGDQDEGQLDFRIIRRNGDIRWISHGCRAVFGRDGRFMGRRASNRDVTERVQAEARLQDSEERFRSLVEVTTDWVWETDQEGRFCWVSESLGSVVGVPVDAILGKCRWELASSDFDGDPAIWQAHRADLAEHRSFRDLRYWLRSADGTAKWISVNGSPRFDGGGRFLGYRGSGSDVTAEASTALRLKMLSTAVEQSPVSVVITDPDGRIQYVNAALAVASGYSVDEVMGKNPRIFASGETPPAVYQDMWATITEGSRWTGELRNRRKDGEMRWESLVVAPVLNEAGRVAHYVAIKEDITERRQLQDRLRETNAELEQFAYVASHDLRQPLRMVTSYLSLIEGQFGQQLGEEGQSFLRFAVDGARRMDRLILDLLEYSRTGKAGEPRPTPLAEALGIALANLAEAVAQTHAEIVVAEDLPVVTGDLPELARLFQNLIGNAVKYHAADRPPKIAIGCRRMGKDWLVSVKDNGIGIAAADHERAFALFQRLVPRTAYEGTGIGLAICKKIVERHGGRIWIESEVGKGSTFCFTLSSADKPPDASPIPRGF